MSISRRRFLAGAGVAATGLVRPAELLGRDPVGVEGTDAREGGPDRDSGRAAGERQGRHHEG
ncbi:MAG: twin-arginine translocation signal domain-containing protein, partial [Longimicrobiales bacterium]